MTGTNGFNFWPRLSFDGRVYINEHAPSFTSKKLWRIINSHPCEDVHEMRCPLVEQSSLAAARTWESPATSREFSQPENPSRYCHLCFYLNDVVSDPMRGRGVSLAFCVTSLADPKARKLAFMPGVRFCVFLPTMQHEIDSPPRFEPTQEAADQRFQNNILPLNVS
jgi:hypothetical protein